MKLGHRWSLWAGYRLHCGGRKASAPRQMIYHIMNQRTGIIINKPINCNHHQNLPGHGDDEGDESDEGDEGEEYF